MMRRTRSPSSLERTLAAGPLSPVRRANTAMRSASCASDWAGFSGSGALGPAARQRSSMIEHWDTSIARSRGPAPRTLLFREQHCAASIRVSGGDRRASSSMQALMLATRAPTSSACFPRRVLLRLSQSLRMLQPRDGISHHMATASHSSRRLCGHARRGSASDQQSVPTRFAWKSRSRTSLETVGGRPARDS